MTGLASEEVLLDWPMLALRCGRPEAALAAAQRAAAAMPQAPALQQQLLVLQAQHCTMQVRPPCTFTVYDAAHNLDNMHHNWLRPHLHPCLTCDLLGCWYTAGGC